MRHLAFHFQVDIQLYRQNPTFKCSDEMPAIDMSAVGKFCSDCSLPNKVDSPAPTLHLYWDTVHREFVCFCVGLPVFEDDSKETKVQKEDPSTTLNRIFHYPHGFERFYRVLEISSSAKSKKEFTEARQKAMKTTVFRSFFESIPEKDRVPAHNTFFNDQEKTIGMKLGENDKNDEDNKNGESFKFRPLETLKKWLDSHYLTTCVNDCCHGFLRIQNFVKRKAGSFHEMCAFMKLICVFRHLSYFDFSNKKLLSHLDKETLFFVEDQQAYKRTIDIPEADINKNHFIFCRDLDSCVCIFEGNGSKSMFDLACSDLNFNVGWPMSLKQFVAMQKHSSAMTARWLRHDSGHTLKVWAHMPKRDYAKCETEKCENRGQKWRHMIYSYAVMALLWNEFNGNKEGPLGHYPTRSAQRMAFGGSSSSNPMQVYASKKGGFPLDYVGHNVVALAVGKRGDILRIAYNHNTLFSSTVDHAEERLIDGLYREPTNLVQRSHAKIYDAESRENLEVEKHMQHISVYTSLEPCQQCSGKMLLALVPEVISCQRDWDIKLLGDQLYNQTHKCRAVLASHFDFSPYDDLGRTYSSYRERVNRDKMSFFTSEHRNVPAKGTMPYFLCTDEAHAIFKRGHDVFDKVFHILFHKDQSSRPVFDDFPCQFFKVKASGPKPSTARAQDKIDLLLLFNIDVSDWLDDSDKNATDIRNFRPSLSDKKNRILHDELLHLRQSWVSNVFKQMCTLTFFCDRNCTIDESDIERKLSPLGDITSINLLRTIEGELKGIFTVTFASYDIAMNVKECLDKIIIRPVSKHNDLKDVEADFPPGFRVNSVGFKRKEYINASQWLHQIREPLAFELFLPSYPDYYHDDSDNLSIPAAFNPYIHVSKTKTLIRKWPISHHAESKLCERESKVLHIKCTDIASTRRLKCELPNFDEPNNIRVIFLPTTEDVSGTRVYTSKLSSPTNVHAGTFTLIARTDVTEGQMLNYLNECFPQHGCSPFSLRFSCITLTSCNSSQTLKWIDVRSVSMRCFDWKVWSIPFVCKFGSVGAAELGADQIDPKFSILCQMQPVFTSQKLPRRYFCQPYPQSVLDFDVCVQDKCYKLRSILLHPEQSPEPQPVLPALPNPQNPPNPEHTFVFNVTKVSRANEQDKAAKEVSIIFLFDRERQSCEIVTDTETKTERSKYVTIEICESSLVTLISSYMLIENKQDVKALFDFVVTEKGGKYFDFWGKEFQICIEEKKASERKRIQERKGTGIDKKNVVDEIIGSLLSIRSRNLLGLRLHIDSADFLKVTFDSSRPTGHSCYICEFCGVYTDFPVLKDDAKILNVCCAAHTKGNDQSKFRVPKMEKLKVGHYKIKNLWKKASEVENEFYESHVDPAKDMHPRRYIESILQRERDLQLELCVSNKSYRASRIGNNHIGSVSFLLRRDEVFGPAQILFCMYIPLEMNDGIRFQIGVLGHPSVASVFGPNDIDIVKAVESGNRQKSTNAGKGKKVYGRLKDPQNRRHPLVTEPAKKVNHNQGGNIPADALRKFLEPEYFPELFALDKQNSFTFYPTLDFLEPDAAVIGSGGSNSGDDSGGKAVIGSGSNGSKSSDVAFVSLHSWDFSELQTPELSRLLLCQKQIHVAEFDELKKRAEIQEKAARLCEKRAEISPELVSSVFMSTVPQNHDYFKECLHFLYDDTTKAGIKKLIIPSKFKNQLFPRAAWESFPDKEIKSPECFIKLLDDLVLSQESRQVIADFLPLWQHEKFSLGYLVDFLGRSKLHWSKYECLKASIAKTSDSSTDEDETENKTYDAFLDLIGNSNSNARDSAAIKQRLARTKNEDGSPNFANLPKDIDTLVSDLKLTWDNLKRTQFMIENAKTAKDTLDGMNDTVQNKILKALQDSMQQCPESSDQSDYLFRSFMTLMHIDDSKAHFNSSKESIKLCLREQMDDTVGTSNLHKAVATIGVCLVARVKEIEGKKDVRKKDVESAKMEKATFFKAADPIFKAQRCSETFEIAKADAVAAFLTLIGYPALLTEKNKRAIRDSFNKSESRESLSLSSLMNAHLPSSLKKIQGYFLEALKTFAVPPQSCSLEKIEAAFGGKTLNLKPAGGDLLQNFATCLSQGTLEETLKSICDRVEEKFKGRVVKEQDGPNLLKQSEFGILKELERLQKCLNYQVEFSKTSTLADDYDRAFSACVSLFQNEPTTAKGTTSTERSNVDVAFLIIELNSPKFLEPIVTRNVSDTDSIQGAFSTLDRKALSSFQEESKIVFSYDGGVVSGQSTLRDISYEPLKTIYVTAAKRREVERAAAAATAAVPAEAPAPLQQPTVKLTRKTLQAMTSREVVLSATRRAGLAPECALALQNSAVSGATYQSDWTRASLEAKLMPHFGENIRDHLRNTVDALLEMKAEAEKKTEYSKMIETFKFFLHRDPITLSRPALFSAANLSLAVKRLRTASKVSLPTMPRSVSNDLKAATHSCDGGGGFRVDGGKSIFEKVSSTRAV